jgi:hypothetical protein
MATWAQTLVTPSHVIDPVYCTIAGIVSMRNANA